MLMNSIQYFVDQSRKVGDREELRGLTQAIATELGFDYFALVHHVDLKSRGGNRFVAISTYPTVWVEEYVERSLATHDPVHLASHRTSVVFSWDEVPSLVPITAAHRKVREDTIRAGISTGFTVPANVPGDFHGSCSFAVKAGRILPEKSRMAVQLVGAFAFSAARRLLAPRGEEDQTRPNLTTRQLQCLILVGQGKTDGEIGTILGIAEDTVTEHLDEVRRRLDVSRRIQGVFRAVFQGQIALSDVVR